MNDKYLMLDFAETLGYRVEDEFEGDIQIVADATMHRIEKVKEANEKIRKQIDIYDRTPKWFASLEKERLHYIVYFELVLTELRQDPKLAYSIVDYKIAAKRHAIYEDVLNFFEQTKFNYKFIVVSDGMPSRSMTLKNLGLDKYLAGIYISDEIGLFKSDPKFFQRVFTKLNIINPQNTYLIDDSIKSIESANILNINTFLIDRKGKTPNSFSSLSEIAKVLKLK